MKKATLTFGLLSLVVLTSFTTIQDSGDDDNGTGGTTTTTTTTTTTDRRDTGNQDPGNGGKKHDIVDPIPFTSQYQYPNQDIPSRKKSDF